MGVMNKNIRKITEGALMIAIIALLLLLNRQFGNILEGTVYWILSFPIMIYAARYGLRDSLVVFVSSLLISLMLAAPTTIFYLFVSLVVGITYGSLVRKKVDNKIVLGVTIIIEIISLIITTVLLAGMFGYDITSEIEIMSNTLNQFDSYADTKQLAVMMVVIIYVGSSIMEALVIHLFGHIILKRLKIDVLELKSIYEITYPKYMAVIIVIAFGLYYLCNLGLISKIYENYLIAVYIICFIIGVSDGIITLLCIIRNKKLSKGMVFLAMLSGFIPVINNLVFVLGVYDIYTNYKMSLERRVKR